MLSANYVLVARTFLDSRRRGNDGSKAGIGNKAGDDEMEYAEPSHIANVNRAWCGNRCRHCEGSAAISFGILRQAQDERGA